MTVLREWVKLNVLPSIVIGVLLAVILGFVAQVVVVLKKRRDSRILDCGVLSDGAAALENMRRIYTATVHRFDCLAVTGGTLVRKWIPQIEECARRGVKFRFLFADMSDSHCQAFARSIKKDPALLKAEIDDVVNTLTGIKQRVPSAQIDVLYYAGHSPLYSMWISDSAESGESNIQVHLYGGLGNGPIVRGNSPQLHRTLSQEFEDEWRLGKP